MTFLTRIAGAAMLVVLSVASAQARYVVDLTQQGTKVVATGSGTLDLTDLTLGGPSVQQAKIGPLDGFILTGPATSTPADLYVGINSGPTSFGNAAGVFASSGSGDLVGILGNSFDLFVPHGYASGATLSGTATYSAEEPFCEFQCLIPGVYEWTWGTAAHADSFTLEILLSDSAAPEPPTWVMMLAGFAGLGLAAWTKVVLGRREAA